MRIVGYDRFGKAEKVTVIREQPSPEPSAHDVLDQRRLKANCKGHEFNVSLEGN
jgi:hypothetical protein